jgi:hypothetical protein
MMLLLKLMPESKILELMNGSDLSEITSSGINCCINFEYERTLYHPV